MRKGTTKRKPRRHKVGRGAGAVFVRGIRKRLRLTQAGLAARLGIAQMTISRWESGEAPLRPAFRIALQAVAAVKGGKRK
jgi:DNA-binding transcriptional regulator YiaG